MAFFGDHSLETTTCRFFEETSSLRFDMIPVEQMRTLLNNRLEPLLPLHERASNYVTAVEVKKVKGNVRNRRRLPKNIDTFLVIDTEANLQPTKVRNAIFSQDNNLSIDDCGLCSYASRDLLEFRIGPSRVSQISVLELNSSFLKE